MKTADQRSPREVFEAAMAAPPMTPDDLAEARTLEAREMARAEDRRRPSPQLPLEVAA